jgi:hypothetical protein
VLGDPSGGVHILRSIESSTSCVVLGSPGRGQVFKCSLITSLMTSRSSRIVKSATRSAAILNYLLPARQLIPDFTLLFLNELLKCPDGGSYPSDVVSDRQTTYQHEQAFAWPLRTPNPSTRRRGTGGSGFAARMRRSRAAGRAASDPQGRPVIRTARPAGHRGSAPTTIPAPAADPKNRR